MFEGIVVWSLEAQYYLKDVWHFILFLAEMENLLKPG